MENTVISLSAKLIIVASRDSVVPPLIEESPKNRNTAGSKLSSTVRAAVHA